MGHTISPSKKKNLKKKNLNLRCYQLRVRNEKLSHQEGEEESTQPRCLLCASWRNPNRNKLLYSTKPLSICKPGPSYLSAKAHLAPYSESCNSSEYHSPGAPWGGLVGTDSGSQAIKKGTVHTSPQRGTSRKPFCSPRVCESTSKILEPYTASLMEDSDDGLNQTQKKKKINFRFLNGKVLHALKHSK